MNRPALIFLPILALIASSAMAVAVLIATAGDPPATPGMPETRERDEAQPDGREEPRPKLAGDVCQGSIRRPDPGEPRIFSPQYAKRRDVAGFAIVGNAEVDDPAMEAAARTVERVFAGNGHEEPLIREGAYVIVMATGQGVLDLPEFSCLKAQGNTSFFTHVCGIADVADYPVVTVSEDDLLGRRSGPCGGVNILFHELGHLVQGWTLDHVDYLESRYLYQSALDAGKYRNQYAARNFHEYFADGTQAYFDSVERGGTRDREWLRKYDPALFKLLTEVYGE